MLLGFWGFCLMYGFWSLVGDFESWCLFAIFGCEKRESRGGKGIGIVQENVLRRAVVLTTSVDVSLQNQVPFASPILSNQSLKYFCPPDMVQLYRKWKIYYYPGKLRHVDLESAFAKEASVVSAAALVAAQCAQVAEDMGVTHEQLNAAMGSAMTTANAANIFTLTAAAATCTYSHLCN
ncbi:uncharacterized protein LOC143846738 isoform X2 [Tasmannia lanceolata]|uniref:uncharacterized protein LOC143846738 isoform X2 n=1 Tax=Tasmannia lanceolata TaxID=3420 RepID=UPI0040633806